MTTKEYLLQIQECRWRVQNCKERLEYLTEISLIASSPSGGKIKSVKHGDSTANTAIKIAEAETKLNAAINRALDTEERITGELEQLNNMMYRQILIERYVNMKTLAKIAEDYSYSYRQICRLHGRALEDFRKHVLECHTDKAL